MRKQRTKLRRVVVALLVAVPLSWCGGPLLARDGDPQSGARVSAVDGQGILATLAEWWLQWLDRATVPEIRSVSAAGGAGMDPNGAPSEEPTPPDSQGGPIVDPNG